MADEPKADDDTTGEHGWVWIPNTSYGPFTFGTHRSRTPHVGILIEEDDMGSGDRIAFYESELGDIDLTFWNDYLTGVTVRDTFSIDTTELIGMQFNDVRGLVPEEPDLSNDVVVLTAAFDAHNMLWYMATDWMVTDIKVGIDPEVVPGGFEQGTFSR